MTSEHIRQMRELRAEKNKLEAERDHWMNEAIDLRRDLERLKQSETDLVNEVERLRSISAGREERIKMMLDHAEQVRISMDHAEQLSEAIKAVNNK